MKSFLIHPEMVIALWTQLSIFKDFTKGLREQIVINEDMVCKLTDN